MVVAVPSAAFGSVVAALPGSAPILSLTKGLDPGTGGRLSQLVRDRPVAVLSGPNIAEEIARGLPAAAVIACDSLALAVQLQLAINSTAFRVYVNDDVVGVELCAAAKNVIALAAGGADGLSLGDNAKAALVARGLAEMGRLAEVSGARPETFAGLAGMGDLIVTCWSPAGRNRRCGELVAQGATPAEAAQTIGMVVEGLTTAPVLQEWLAGSRSRCRSRKGCAPCSTGRPSPSWWAADAPRADRQVAPAPPRYLYNLASDVRVTLQRRRGWQDRPRTRRRQTPWFVVRTSVRTATRLRSRVFAPSSHGGQSRQPATAPW